MSATAQGVETNAERPQVALPTRQVMLPRGTLVSLAERLELLKASTRDVVADTRNLEMAETGRLIVTGEPPAESYPLSHHAHTQLAEKTGIPFRYYERLLSDGHGPLYAQNVNEWLHTEPDRKLVRVADGQVRAILSDRYRVLDNYDLAMLTAGKALDHQADVLQCTLTETHMTVKITVPQYREKLGDLTAAQKALFPGGDTHASRPKIDADYVVPGLIVSNSEVGAGAFRVEPFVFRLVCWNGLIGEESLFKVHLGSRLEVGEIIYSDATRKLDDQALWAKVSDVIDSTFNPKVFAGFVAKLRGAREVEIAKPVEVTDAVAKNLSLTLESKQALLRYFTAEGHNVYGLVNGLTRLAQDYSDPDEQIALERQAGRFLASPDKVAEGVFA